MTRQLTSARGTCASRSRRNAAEVDTYDAQDATTPSAKRRKSKEQERGPGERDDGTQPQCTSAEETDTESIDVPIQNEGMKVTLLRVKASAEDTEGMEVDVANRPESDAAADVASLLEEYERVQEQIANEMEKRSDLKALNNLRKRGLGCTPRNRFVGAVPGDCSTYPYLIRIP